MTPEASPEELRGRLRALAALVPTLEAPDADFGHWVQPPARDGVITMGWYELGPAGEASGLGVRLLARPAESLH